MGYNSPEGIKLPLYPYRCTKCGYKFEKIQSFHAKPETECPKCHGVLERPMTAPSLKFVGKGWYVNDYAGGHSSATAGSEPAPAPAVAPKAETPCAGQCSSCPAAAQNN